MKVLVGQGEWHRPSTVQFTAETASIANLVSSELASWDINDDDFLLRMFTEGQFEGSNSYRVTSTRHEVKSKATLFNLAKLISDGNSRCGTTRVYRFYQRKGDSLELLSRLDWELSAHDTFNRKPSWIADIASMEQSLISDQLLSTISPDAFSRIKHVVIKDNGNGVVNERFFELLKRAYGVNCLDDKKFYVISKTWMPTYLSSIRHRLRFLSCSQFRLQIVAFERGSRQGNSHTRWTGKTTK